jgi:hypothetical protein
MYSNAWFKYFVFIVLLNINRLKLSKCFTIPLGNIFSELSLAMIALEYEPYCAVEQAKHQS